MLRGKLLGIEQEVAGKLAEARQLLQRGCELCPTSEDIWLESARLQSPENGRAILARGVAAIPTSVKLWLQVSHMQTLLLTLPRGGG